MKTALIVAGCIAGGLLLVFVILKSVFALVRRRLLKRMRERFEPDAILRWSVNANFFGLESKGGQQIRGNAALVLTNDELWSCLGAPLRELSIPISDIVGVSLVKSHCGKSVFLDLLRVEFLAEGGRDAGGWFVRDAAAWKHDIEELLGQR